MSARRLAVLLVLAALAAYRALRTPVSAPSTPGHGPDPLAA